MRVAHLCGRLGISTDWLKELERTGFVPRAARDMNGHRRYEEEDLERLKKLLLQRKQGSVGKTRPKKLPRRLAPTGANDVEI